jgi:YfiH family protein
MALPPGWIVPEWPVPARVRAICTTREGGVSETPYDSLNLGDHVGDDADHVSRNRAIFKAALGARAVFLRQVHGTHTVRLAPDSQDGAEADGCMTSAPGVACTIMVADCLPVLLAVDDGRAVGAAHAGWRGLAGGVIESACEAVRGAAGDQRLRPENVLAWLGPCIGPKAFEVGPEVKAAFEAHDPGASDLFEPYREGKWLANLPGLARRRLASLGITRVYGNDGSGDWCTVANPSRYFSHRRDGASGRFAAGIWRE